MAIEDGVTLDLEKNNLILIGSFTALLATMLIVRTCVIVHKADLETTVCLEGHAWLIAI